MAVNTGAFPPQSFKESQFLSLGLDLRSNGKVKAKRAVKLESQISDFQSVYGPHPRTLEAIWLDLHTTHFMELRIDPTVTPTQFLIVYRWMKAYESEKEMKTAFGFPEAYIRGWCKDITAKVAALRKIKIDPNWQDDDGFVLTTTVDGIHYKIDEPRPFSTSFSSHKEGGNACLDYEICMHAHKDKVAWLNGPYPAGTGDREIFRTKLLGAVEAKQTARNNSFRIIADDG